MFLVKNNSKNDAKVDFLKMKLTMERSCIVFGTMHLKFYFTAGEVCGIIIHTII